MEKGRIDLPAEMELKKLHMGTLVFGWDSMDEVSHLLSQALDETNGPRMWHRSMLRANADVS